MPEDGKIGYKSLCIVNSFDDDFFRYLNDQKNIRLENERC